MPGHIGQYHERSAREGAESLGCHQSQRLNALHHDFPPRPKATTTPQSHMKTNRSKLGLSIIAGGLSFVGSANAIDLIVNGSFENPNAGEWKYYLTYNHTQAYFTGADIPGTEVPGTKYSWRHASALNAWESFVTPTNLTDFLQYTLQYADAQMVNLTNALTGTA